MSTSIPSQPSSVADQSERYGSHAWYPWLLALLGLVGGVVWFSLNVSLEPAYRGLKCCDASIYVRLSENGPGFAWSHSSERIFGYPFFLATFRMLADRSGDFLLPALIAQIVAYFGSCFVLVYALRRSGLNVPPIALALLLTHPALCGLAAVSLADSLTTSVITCAIAVIILITADDRYFKTKSATLGFLFSLALILRLSLTAFAALATILVTLTIFAQSFRSAKGFVGALRRTFLFAIFYVAGLFPLSYHLIDNCHRAHGEFCIIPSYANNSAVVESLSYAINHSRMWGIVAPDGRFDWGKTDDRYMSDCALERAAPVKSLLACYTRHLDLLPAHFFGRIRGLFDYHHLNPYAATATSVSEAWIIRSFSVVGYIGLFTCVALLAVALYRRSLAAHIYLTLPPLYLAIQSHFHGEARYIAPIIPLLFTLGAATLCANPFPKRWHLAIFWALALIATANFLLRIQEWDAMALRQFGSI